MQGCLGVGVPADAEFDDAHCLDALPGQGEGVSVHPGTVRLIREQKAIEKEPVRERRESLDLWCHRVGRHRFGDPAHDLRCGCLGETEPLRLGTWWHAISVRSVWDESSTEGVPASATNEYAQPGIICARPAPGRRCGRTTGPHWSSHVVGPPKNSSSRSPSPSTKPTANRAAPMSSSSPQAPTSASGASAGDSSATSQRSSGAFRRLPRAGSRASWSR